jgi:hypothetical protein
MKNQPHNNVHIAGRGSVVRQLRILASQFRVLRTGTLSEIRPDNMYQPLGLFVILMGISCDSDLEKNGQKESMSEFDREKYLANGQLDSLFDNQDTLKFFINLSGCIDRRFHYISFYKDNGAIYIKPEIRIIFDGDTVILPSVKKYSKLSDSLSFERLFLRINEFHKMTLGLSDSNTMISIGVKRKWGKFYYFDRDEDYFIDIKYLYLHIMRQFYPEIAEYDMDKEIIVFDQ